MCEIKVPTSFPKTHDDIEKIIMSPINQSLSPIKPTTPLTPSAPSSPLFIQFTYTPLIPSAPSNLSPVIAPPLHISPTLDDSSTISKSPTSNPQQLPLTLCKRNHVNSICKAIVCMLKKVLTVRIPFLP